MLSIQSKDNPFYTSKYTFYIIESNQKIDKIGHLEIWNSLLFGGNREYVVNQLETRKWL